MINDLKIPCPTCKSDITYNVAALLEGASFGCLICSSQIKIASTSVSELKSTYEKYNELKSTLSTL
jgi:transcription initiation factor IIE alpha subunit